MSANTLPYHLHCAYIAGRYWCRREQDLKEARRATGEWRCQWVKYARESHKEFLKYIRAARGAARSAS